MTPTTQESPMTDEPKVSESSFSDERRKGPYRREADSLRRHLIGMLCEPTFGRRSWSDLMQIGEALIQLEMETRIAERAWRNDHCIEDRPDLEINAAGEPHDR